ncbi:MULTISPECIES: acyltransferase [unclassified Rhizobium]|uniref:acyltransferase family protein n=1 Tax=unclassified Rhizobium TaxID=2613769 RepID=UPI001FCEAF67|nr:MULTISPECIES: acyltransferase [unclassified Rhizobium]
MPADAVKGSRLQTLQAGRAIAAIFVLLYHTEITLSLPKYYGVHTFSLFKAGHFGVMYFFALSGYLMVTVHRNDLGEKEKVASFFYKRFIRIYPLLWVALLFMFCLNLASGIKSLPTLPNLLMDITAAPVLLSEPLLTVEWTLRHEILFYLICGLAIWRPKIGLSILLAWGLAPLLAWGDVGPFRVLVSPYNILFIFGGLSAVAVEHLSSNSAKLILLVGAATLAFTWTMEVGGNALGYSYPTIFAYGIASAMFLCAASKLELSGLLVVPKWLNFLGAASYSIYLIHFAAISVMCKVAVWVSSHYDLPRQLVFVTVATVALLVGIIFHLMVERPMMKHMKYIFRPPAYARQSGN